MKPKSPPKKAVRPPTRIKKGLLKSLPKQWNKFLVLKDYGILNGLYSQAHRRYKGRNMQGSSICVVACAMARLNKVENWTSHTLDQILELGTNLYLKTLQVTNNKCLGILRPTQIYKYFFIGNLKITMSVGVDTMSDKISKDTNMSLALQERLNKFLNVKEFGIFSSQNKFFSIWKFGDSYFLFDPKEHEMDGTKWRGVPGLGYCCAMKFKDLMKMADMILSNIELKQTTNFAIYPCLVEKVVKIDSTPPETIEGRQPEAPQVAKTTIPPTRTKKPKEELKTEDGVPLSKVPPEKPKIKSETKFAGIPGFGDGKCGILRATTHQKDPRFSKYRGAQEFPNAIAALTMLRLAKAKHWNRVVLDQILKLGERIHHESKALQSGQITDKIELNDRFFTPKIKKFGTLGVLGSTKPEIWDLRPALTNFFAENDCCVILGPYKVAVWLENGLYYMFDPNERDSSGRTNPTEPGVACVTWYDNLKSLVDTYMSNVPLREKSSKFYLAQVKIVNYVEVPSDWNNYKALTTKKWILRGNFSQNNTIFDRESRGVQCTANATMSLVFAKLKPPTDWSRDTIDEVLIKGDDLYKKSVQDLVAADKYSEPLLLLDEIKRTFPLDEKIIDLVITDCKFFGLIKGPSMEISPNLREGLKLFFDEYEAGVITACAQSFAIFKQDGAYYYFDSHTRDEQGISSAYGTACLLRHEDINDLLQSLLSNIGACTLNYYNIGVVDVHLIEQREDGIIKPPLNNFTELTDCVAILQSTCSQNDEKYGLSRGKQTTPNCLAAVALNQLNKAEEWGKEELDQILDIGDKLYIKSVTDKLNRPIQELPEGEDDNDEINTTNVRTEIKIGKNKFEVEFEDFGQGNFEENLKEILETLRPEVVEEEINDDDEEEEEGVERKPPPEPEANNFQLILESPLLTVTMWKDDHMIYLYDPRPRDETGQIYGKDDWSVVIEEVEEEETVDDEKIEEEEDEEEGDDDERDDKAGGDFEDDTQSKEEVEDEETEDAVLETKPEKKGSAYWREKEKDGKACVIRFCRLSNLINHLLENTPPTHREELEFTLKTVKLTNIPIAHEIFDPEVNLKTDDIAGDWHNFKEVDYGKWCLRGTKTLFDPMFLEINRGLQEIPVCLNAIAFAKIFNLAKFKPSTIDTILGYGDRLLTFVRRSKLKELKANKELNLSDEECEAIVATLNFTLQNYPKKFCVSEKLVTVDIKEEVVVGDASSKIPDEIPDLKTGIKIFFKTEDFGLLSCKNLLVAIWQVDNVFYMFDPQARGPNGIESTLGVPCITRFVNSDSLAFIFKHNLPKFGEGLFLIHSVTVSEGVCPRDRQPEEKVEKPIKLGGFQVVVPGRSILRGDVQQDFSMFERGVHVESPAIAFVALTMSLIQKPETWTKLVVNEILQIGDDLHNDTIEKLGMKFNPWAQKIDIYRVSNDFNVGRIKANTALRHMEQRGIVDVKNSKTPNLRQGFERFFEENTHGILQVANLVLGVWEEEREGEEPCIYLFDPNPRGPTGLPTTGGVACVMKFCNAVVLTEHIMSSLMGFDKENLEYAIVPVEIVVGAKKTRRKHKKSPCEKKKEVKAKDACMLVSNVPKQCKDKPDKNKPITCPSKCVAVQEKQTLRRIAEDERKKLEAKRLALLGRNEWYKINDNEFLVRGLKYSKQYHDLPTCVVAFVLLKITNLEKFNMKNIEMVLKCGEQLYMDCYNAYNPPNPVLGLEHLLRKFYLKSMQTTISVFRPIECGVWDKNFLFRFLEKYFIKNNFALLYYLGQWVALLMKQGYYYYFDPYSRTLEGVPETNGKGCAILMKIGDLNTLAERVWNNLKRFEEGVEDEKFALVMIALKSIQEMKEN